MSTVTIRPELPPPTQRIRKLPIDQRGYPVPYFVAWIDEDFNEVGVGSGRPDFRIVRGGMVTRCINESRCWICGEKLGVHKAFVIGPMCAVNRTSAEPPSHYDCAEWATRACPFLVRPHMKRNDATPKPETEEPAGVMLRRNPGVIGIWVTRKYQPWREPRGGILLHIGTPESVRWICEGRTATRAEVEAAIESGLPALRELCQDADEHKALDLCVKGVKPLLPPAT